MNTKQEKQRFTFWTQQKTLDEITEWSERIGSKSKSEFIEDAIQFYIGYLATEESTGFMPEFLNNLINSNIESLEDRLCNVIFKIAVELGMLLHAFCAINDIPEETIKELRDGVIKEVRSLNDITTFKRADRLQNSYKYEDD